MQSSSSFRAQPPSRHSGWTWIFAWAGLIASGSVDTWDLPGMREVGVSAIIGMAFGTLWQGVGRRDVAHRLTFLSAWFVIGVLSLLISPTVRPNLGSADGAGVVGLAVGVVLTERFLAWRNGEFKPENLSARGTSRPADIAAGPVEHR